MKALRILIGFVPFLLFTIVGYWLSVGWAAVIGLVAALAVIAVSVASRTGGPPMLPIVQAVVLVVFAVLGFAAGPAVRAFLLDYGRGLASVALAVVILVTAFFAPFTAQFARAAVPVEETRTATFRRVNRSLSLAWGLAVLVVGACHLAVVGMTGGAALLLHWVVPIGAFVAVLSYSKRVAGRASRPTPTS